MAQDALERLVGDGRAKVTCSIGLKDSNYGSGFEAFCSVQLTCNQDRASVQAAHGMAQELAEEGMGDVFEVAKELFTARAAAKQRK